MNMEDKRLIFISISLVGVIGLIGYLYLRRKKEMNTLKSAPSRILDQQAERIAKECSKQLSDRDKKELQEKIKAMTLQEQEALLEVIPVSLCMHRIQAELDHAREFESMIKKAYEMK